MRKERQTPQRAAPARAWTRGTAALSLLLCGAAWVATAPAQTVAPRVTPASAAVEPALTLREAAQLAVLNNPDVLARWHSVRASEGERDAAKGGLLPRVDLSASTGPERRSTLPN